MNARQARKAFVAASWPSVEAQKAWVREAAQLPASDLEDFIGLLQTARGTTVDQRRARFSVWTMIVEASPDRSWFAPMLKAAVRGDLALRRILQPLLLLCNDRSEHVELVKLLRQSDSNLRRFAADVLRDAGGRTALGEIERTIDMGGWTTRQDAMEVAMALGGHYAIPVVGRVVEVGAQQEVVGAIRLLSDERFVRGSLRGAADAIEPALQSPHARVVMEAMKALAVVSPHDVYFDRVEPFLYHEDTRLQRAAIECLARTPSPQTLATLIQLYGTADQGTREVILGVMADIGDDTALPLLVEALGDPALPIRNRASAVVVELARSRSVDPTRMLLWLLRSKDATVRRQAVEIIGQVGEPLQGMWPKLLRLLRDTDWWVRERVVDALVKLAGSQLTRHVAQYLEDPSDVVRRYAVEVLMRLEDPQSLGVLLETAKNDTDWWVRERAVECLGAIGDPKIIPHLSGLADGDATMIPVIVQALGAIGHADCLPLLLRFLEHVDSEIRLQALQVVGLLGTRDVAPHVRPLMSDADPKVRAYAKNLMMGWRARMGTDTGTGVAAKLKGLERMLWWATKQGGDDLFLVAESPPFIKKFGSMVQLGDVALTSEYVENTLRSAMTNVQRAQFDRLEDVDFSMPVAALGLRFRVNVFRQVTGVAAVFRRIQQDVRPLPELGLPPLLERLCDLPDGLVLIGGPTGSGKSTTLAAMIHHINRRQGRHIITIEDPIEVMHEHDQSVVTQREVGSHTESFSAALRATLREDPDVILVGEMRDLDTIAFALSAAETGHLVLATVHTVSADTTIDRLIDAFPLGHQEQIRALISQSLRAVVCQHLLKTKDGEGRVPSVEILMNNDAVSSLIRKGQCYQLPSIITTSREQGMQSMDDELYRLALQGVVSGEEAYAKAIDKGRFEGLLAAEASERETRAMQVSSNAIPRPFATNPRGT